LIPRPDPIDREFGVGCRSDSRAEHGARSVRAIWGVATVDGLRFSTFSLYYH
jgi:hypothetical protein